MFCWEALSAGYLMFGAVDCSVLFLVFFLNARNARFFFVFPWLVCFEHAPFKTATRNKFFGIGTRPGRVKIGRCGEMCREGRKNRV